MHVIGSENSIRTTNYTVKAFTYTEMATSKSDTSTIVTGPLATTSASEMMVCSVWVRYT